MNPEALPVVNAILGVVNFVTLLIVAFTGGRWMGRVDTRLDHLEAHHHEGRGH